MSNGNLNAEYPVRPPSSKVSLDDVTTNAIFCYDGILATINDIENVLPVLPGAFKNKSRLV